MIAKTIVTTVLFSLIALSSFAQGEYITAYENKNFGGNKMYFRVGERIAYLANGEKRGNGSRCEICNDDISSIAVPKGLKVTVYEDKDFHGRSRVITEDCSYVGMDWNDKISSLVVERNFTEPVITFYKDANYQGGYEEFKAGDQVPLVANGKKKGSGCTICNDDISSVKVPPGLKVTVFEDANYKGRSRVITADCPYVGSDWNDKISSFYVENDMPVMGGGVTFYQDANFGGDHMTYSVGDQITLIANGQLRGSGCAICNDDISSIKIPPGVKVTVFEDANFQGRSRVIMGDCNYVGNDWNDRISSFIIEPVTIDNRQINNYNNGHR